MENLENTLPVGPQRLKEFMAILQRYKAGKTGTEKRILASENWWKLRNANKPTAEAEGEFVSRSGWLHNVIVSKHADAMDAYPEPNILPREASDRDLAQMLSAIVPCVLEQNAFEQTYSDVLWQKLKTGTGVYKVYWDARKHSGLGDIGIRRVNLLNLYWEPGITNLQESSFLFHTELQDKALLRQQYPQLRHSQLENTFLSTKFLYDDVTFDQDKVTVIDVYYRKWDAGRQVLHYCKFLGETVLYATENDTEPTVDLLGHSRSVPARDGLYEHGRYPYVLDVLYPIEGSPCGYGYVDLCRNPQTEIDILKTAFVKNARVGAVPRYFSRVDGNVNEEQFLDLDQALVKVSGNVDEATLRKIEHNTLDGNYIAMLDRTIDELRQTSGNTEASTGSSTAGVTAASAIAALQEASGKGSRDATLTSYRAYAQVVELTVELMRQFYDLPRQFRILGDSGAHSFVSFTNQGLRPVAQPGLDGQQLLRRPVFDIKISPQRRNAYSRISQNELALQFFKLGFFNPMVRSQAMMCLQMMDFEGKDSLLQQLSAMPDVPETIPATGEDITLLPPGEQKKEHAAVTRARQRALGVTQPNL